MPSSPLKDARHQRGSGTQDAPNDGREEDEDEEELRVPSPPPPRRLSRSSIDLRDLELHHEKINHTDSAPSIVGIDRYLKSSDSEPLQFQQQLRQQLKFQEQIQQQYYLGVQKTNETKPKTLRQNSLKKINNFLQPFFFPGHAQKSHSMDMDTMDDGDVANEEDIQQGSAKQSLLPQSNAQESIHDARDDAEEEENDNEPKINGESPRLTLSDSVEGGDENEIIEVGESNKHLNGNKKNGNFYLNLSFCNDPITALWPVREQYVKMPSSYKIDGRVGGGKGVALSESDFLTIKDLEFELKRGGDNQRLEPQPQHEYQQLDTPGGGGDDDGDGDGCGRESRARIGLRYYGRGEQRRRSSSCEEIRSNATTTSCLLDTLQKKKAKFGDRKTTESVDEKLRDDEDDEAEASAVLWRNFANKSRFGSTLKKFNSSSRLLVGSLFGDRSSGKYRHFRRNNHKSAGEWSMDESCTMTTTGESVQRGCFSVDIGDETEHGRQSKGSKENDDQLKNTTTTTTTIIASPIIGGLLKEALVVPNKNNEKQRMRVCSDGDFDGRQIEDVNKQIQRRPRVLSEGHESNSQSKSLVLGLNNNNFNISSRVSQEHGNNNNNCESPAAARTTTTAAAAAGVTTATTTTSTNDTPDILVGLVDVVDGTAEDEEAKEVGLEKERTMIDLSYGGDSATNSETKMSMDKVLLMDMSEEEQQRFLASGTGDAAQVSKATVTSNGNLSIVDQELLRAISNVTPVNNQHLGQQQPTAAAKRLGLDVTMATKPEIVMDSTVGESPTGNGKIPVVVDECCGVVSGSNGGTVGNTKSPSALLKRDENGMRLRQASVVTYDVNVINFGGPDELSASDNYNYNYNGHGSFSSAAGNSTMHNGRQSTSSASE